MTLLVDSSFADLPLELLPTLRSPRISSLTRDLSAALLAARLRGEPPIARKTSLGVIADPRNEIILPPKPRKQEGVGEGQKVEEGLPVTLGAAVEEWRIGSSLQGSALLGIEQMPSPPEWQRMMISSSGVVYIGPGPLFAQLGPQHVATLPLSSCSAVLLLDKLESDTASRRFAKEANQKSSRRMMLENPHVSAGLLSLTGVKTVLTNQWSGVGSINSEMLQALIDSMANGNSLGAALAVTARTALRGALTEPDTNDSKRSSRGKTSRDSQPRQGYKLSISVLANPIIYGLPSLKLV